MKTFLRSSFAVFAIALFFNAFAVTDATAQGPLNEIFKRMEAHRNRLQTLRANVMMDKFNSQLGIRDVRKGKAAYIPSEGKNATFRIDWTDPEEILSVVNKTYVIYNPKHKQAIIGNADKAKGSGKANNLFSFLNLSRAELKQNYAVRFIGRETVKDGTATSHLEMTPNVKSQFKIAEMWVDDNGMPLQIKITENNNDTMTIFLSDLEKNKSLNYSYFKIKLPDGTKKIKG